MAVVCESNKIDSNITTLAYAEEECLKQLPANPTWYSLAPNSYSDFGGELTTVASSPIGPSRQNKKGSVTDLDASGGFNMDVTSDNLTRLMQGFCFADAREVATTQSLLDAPVAFTKTTVSGYVALAGLDVFKPGMLVRASGFNVETNNGIKTVTAAIATEVTVLQVLIAETVIPATAMLEQVGYVLPTANEIQIVGGLPRLVNTAVDFTTYTDLFVGKWLFVGGDLTTERFVNNTGFARIKQITANYIVFDDTTWKPVAETLAGEVYIFSGTVVKNEDEYALIKRRSYNIERTLGTGPFGDQQAEYLEGAVANEFTLNIPTADKMNADLSFVACDDSFRSGDVDDKVKDGTRVKDMTDDIYNTSSDVYRIKMSIHDPATSTPTALFGYVSEASIAINNNVTGVKAIGVLGAFDTTAGNFDVSGSATVYFTDVAALKAIRRNADVAFSVIAASKNEGLIFDIPLVTLGGGSVDVSKDEPITVPLDSSAAENAAGYTLLYQTFAYLPDIAMPL